MLSLSLRHRRSAPLFAAIAVLAVAVAPTVAHGQASLTYQPPDTVAYTTSADGSAIIGVDNYYSVTFIEKNGVRTHLTLGGVFGAPWYWTPDFSTVVGVDYDESFNAVAWIWHEGDATPTPIPALLGVPLQFMSVSADGSTIFGIRYQPNFFDVEGFVVRNGVYSALTYPEALSTTPAAISADGKLVVGTVYTFGPNFELVTRAAVWHEDGSVTFVPLPPNAGAGATLISADGLTVAGLVNIPAATPFLYNQATFVWKAGEPVASIIYLGGDQPTYVVSMTPDGSAVVGYGSISFNVFRGYVWRNGVLTILNPPPGRTQTDAWLASTDGYRIIGTAWAADSRHDQEMTVWDGGRPPQLIRDILAANGVTAGPRHLDQPFGTSFNGTTIVGDFFDPTNPDYSYGSFVAVVPLPTPTQLLQDLTTKVQGLGLPQGLTNALTVKLNAAIAALASNDTAGATSAISDFINLVNAQRGKKIPAAAADELIADAQAILQRLTG